MTRSNAPIDDLTLSGLSGDRKPRARRKTPAHVDAWDRVAAECPCCATADDHRVPVNGTVRVHIATVGQPIQCVPGMVDTSKPHSVDYTPATMPERWRKSDHYIRAELCGRTR